MLRKLSFWLLPLMLLAGAGTLVWTALDLPAPRLLLAHGFPAGQRPTGRVALVEGIEFVEISPGYFRMGSEWKAVEGDLLGRICGPLGLPFGTPTIPSDEMPLHWVEFPRGFWIARTEITNEQYERFVGGHERDADSPGDRQPVVSVSWDEAKLCCASLGRRTGLPVRLPTEAEWECACRAGTRTEYCFGDDPARLGAYGWYGVGSGGPHPVGELRPNAWGLFDMHGNVWEWCEDGGDPGFGPRPVSTVSPDTGEEFRSGIRVIRGGAYHSPAKYCRSAERYGEPRGDRWRSTGFRLAFSLSPEQSRLVERYLSRE